MLTTTCFAHHPVIGNLFELILITCHWDILSIRMRSNSGSVLEEQATYNSHYHTQNPKLTKGALKLDFRGSSLGKKKRVSSNWIPNFVWHQPPQKSPEMGREKENRSVWGECRAPLALTHVRFLSSLTIVTPVTDYAHSTHFTPAPDSPCLFPF